MSLSDTAKNLRQQAISPELRWLREMRKYVNTYTQDKINKMWMQISEFEKGTERYAPGGIEKVCLMIAHVQECSELAEFYRRTLKYAEIKERKEKDGGEKSIRIHRKELEKIEEKIKIKYRKERKLQISLEDMEEGEADGHYEGGNDPFAAADGE